MTVTVTPHLNFRGQARAALEFYRDALGGDIVLVTYRDAGDVQEPASADQIMWGQVASETGVRIMAYDVRPHMPYEQGVNSAFVSIRGTDQAEIEALWRGLTDGAEIIHEFGPSMWSPVYGMLRDRFGVVWVLDVEVPYAG